MSITPAVTVRGLLDARPESVGLSIELLAGAAGLSRQITSPYIQKTGLALAGFHQYLQPGRILLFGDSEVRFIESLDPAVRRRALAMCFTSALPCLLVTGGAELPAEAVEEGERAGVPVLRTSIPTATAIGKLTAILEDRLAMREIIHGVLLDILGLGVLIVGESGIGKSECALDLVVRGHRLVADDTVEVRRRAESIVIGACPELTRHHMEVRGLGLINIRDLFGVASTRTSKRVELIVQLERWDPSREYDRLGLDDSWYELIGLKVPLIRMPVAPGRNLAILVEVAARNQLLRMRGINAARELAARLDANLAGGGTSAARARGRANSPYRRRGRRTRAGRHGVSKARTPTSWSRFIVVTGLSGSGKSQAIRALEDLGYFCVDNLPVSLLPVMAELSMRQADDHRVAVVMDIREPAFVVGFPRLYRKLRTNRHLQPKLIFLEAGHAELVRRFNETRRPHPLAPDRPVTEGLAEERASLRGIRATADQVIDTSKLNVHELRQALRELVSGQKSSKLVLTFLSFGFQNGPPQEADLMFDVRFLKNPHWVPALRPQTGKDPAVAAYIRRQPMARAALKRFSSLLRWVVPLYIQEGKSYLTVAIGCTGGRHRSVYMAEALKRDLADLKGVATKVSHRDLLRLR